MILGAKERPFARKKVTSFSFFYLLRHLLLSLVYRVEMNYFVLLLLFLVGPLACPFAAVAALVSIPSSSVPVVGLDRWCYGAAKLLAEVLLPASVLDQATGSR